MTDPRKQFYLNQAGELAECVLQKDTDHILKKGFQIIVHTLDEFIDKKFIEIIRQSSVLFVRIYKRDKDGVLSQVVVIAENFIPNPKLVKILEGTLKIVTDFSTKRKFDSVVKGLELIGDCLENEQHKKLLVETSH